jgi:fumarate hydratase, class II
MHMTGPTRTETDSMGSLEVPAEALWGAQTQRAVQNFALSGRPMPRAFLRALGLIKAAAATANSELGLLEAAQAQAIRSAALEIARGEHDAHFPIDVFQTGSGTSSNMNANEVIAGLAARAGQPVHPNDQVNLGQSSNDVIPSAIQVAAALCVHEALQPALGGLCAAIDRRALEFQGLAKTGRTHLMDAMPLTLGQELSTWSAQLADCEAAIAASMTRLRRLPLGGTAVGTGINAHPDFAARAIAVLAALAETGFEPAANRFAGIAGAGAAVELSGQLNLLATVLMKVCNDLRWMNSGPLAGLGEIELPALQPGSSIMPGKFNPVIPEAVAMICAQVIGNHLTISVAGQSGNFQLNVMLPLIAARLIESIELLANGCRALDTQAIAGFRVRQDQLDAALSRNPVLVTALNPVIGYEKAAAIAKRAYAEQRAVLDVAIEMSGLPEAELRRLLDPLTLTRGGVAGGGGAG